MLDATLDYESKRFATLLSTRQGRSSGWLQLSLMQLQPGADTLPGWKGRKVLGHCVQAHLGHPQCSRPRGAGQAVAAALVEKWLVLVQALPQQEEHKTPSTRKK